jgi:hypothetical protein
MARFDDHVIVKSGGNAPNFSNNNLLHSLLGLFSAQLSEARGRLNFVIRSNFRWFSLSFA